jgi:hypothetical protein
MLSEQSSTLRASKYEAVNCNMTIRNAVDRTPNTWCIRKKIGPPPFPETERTDCTASFWLLVLSGAETNDEKDFGTGRDALMKRLMRPLPCTSSACCLMRSLAHRAETLESIS